MDMYVIMQDPMNTYNDTHMQPIINAPYGVKI